MNELMKFDFQFQDKEKNVHVDQDIRVIEINGEPWFVGADVCQILEHTNASSALSRLKDYEKKYLDPKHYLGSVSNQEFTAISESGLYRLVLTSRKPQAEPFQDWVCQEVLPQIRKTGLYNSLPFRLSDDSALVSFEGEDYWVTTTTIAEMFDKEHRNVVRDFQQAQEDYSNALKFERIEDEANELPKFKMIESSYVDTKGRTQRAFKVNRPLFNYVVLGYQGDKAKLYRMKFIKAFEDLERQVKVYLTQQLVFKDPKRQQVYILKNLMTEYIKIGVTNNIDRRRAQLETASGCDIEVVFLAPLADNSRKVEQELHEEFKAYRLRGEWFELDPHKVIKALREKDLVIYPNLPTLGGSK